MADTSIGVGIIGANVNYGWGTRAHIPALQALAEFRLVAVGTTRTENRRADGARVQDPERLRRGRAARHSRGCRPRPHLRARAPSPRTDPPRAAGRQARLLRMAARRQPAAGGRAPRPCRGTGRPPHGGFAGTGGSRVRADARAGRGGLRRAGADRDHALVTPGRGWPTRGVRLGGRRGPGRDDAHHRRRALARRADLRAWGVPLRLGRRSRRRCARRK